MKMIFSLLHKNPDSREDIIFITSAMNVAVNVLVSVVKMIVGLAASSIAIMSEGLNNATDALTSVLTLIGTKLAGKHPDRKHPFGYGRIEYLTGLVVSVLILVTGIEMMINSVKLIFKPEELSISWLSLIIVAVSAVIKFALGRYTIVTGKKTDSGALTAVGLESRNDAIVSAVTILSAVVFLIFHISFDAWAAAFTSMFIIKAGAEVLRNTVSDLLGRPGEKELAALLYKEIRETKGVINAADMMLHNYGPDRYSGSVNVEIDHSWSVGETYALLHGLQLRIMHEHNVVMVFGIYAVDNDHENARRLREDITRFVTETEHVRSCHAVYIAQESKRIYCDLVVDYELRDWKELELRFKDYMHSLYPDQEIMLTLETEFV